MPTVLEFAYLFSPTIHETLKQLTDTGFVYYTSSSSHYEFPDMMTLSFWGTSINSFPNLNRNGKEERQNDFERLERQPRWESLCVS